MNNLMMTTTGEYVTVDDTMSVELTVPELALLMATLSDIDAKKWVDAGMPDEWESSPEIESFNRIQEAADISTKSIRRYAGWFTV